MVSAHSRTKFLYCSNGNERCYPSEPCGRPLVYHEMYAIIAQNIQTALVGVNYNCSKHSESYEQMAEPISANFCTHVHVGKVHLPANFHQYRQLLDL